MTHPQLRVLHAARRGLKLNDLQYRMTLRNVAGVTSSTDLTGRDFENVMATFEMMGFRHPGKSADYWQGKAGKHLAAALDPDREEGTDEQRHKIEAMCAETGLKPEGMCMRMSRGRTDQVHRLTSREAYCVIEALKAIARRGEPEMVPAAAGEDDMTDEEIPF